MYSDSHEYLRELYEFVDDENAVVSKLIEERHYFSTFFCQN